MQVSGPAFWASILAISSVRRLTRSVAYDARSAAFSAFSASTSPCSEAKPVAPCARSQEETEHARLVHDDVAVAATAERAREHELGRGALVNERTR